MRPGLLEADADGWLTLSDVPGMGDALADRALVAAAIQPPRH